MVGGIIRQDHLYPVHSRKVHWERIYRMADYHKVANIVYLGLLGASEEMEEEWKNRFFRRYQQALAYKDIYEKAESGVLGMLDANQIPCIVLASSSVREFYEIPEAAGNSPLQLFFDENNYEKARDYLIDNGYETTEGCPGYGEHMANAADFRVDIFRKIPFETEGLQSGMKKLMEGSYPDPHFFHIRGLSMEYGFIYCITSTVYQYCRNLLTLRRLLDTYLMFRGYQEDMDAALVHEWLHKLGIDEIAEALLHIAAMWFGSRDDDLVNAPKDGLELYDEIERQILSNGLAKPEHEIHQVGQICLQIQKYQQKQEKEREKRKRREAQRIGTAQRIGFLRSLLHPEQKASAGEDGEQKYISGRVTVDEVDFGILVGTPYFDLTLPNLWKNHWAVQVEQTKEDFSNSDLQPEERNPYTYRVKLMIRSQRGDRIPFLTFQVYDDGLNASMVSREENGYYLGKLFHMDADNEYDGHVTVVFDRAIPEREDLELYDMLDQNRESIIASITPVNDPGGQNVNLFERFENWKTEEMPFSFR